ncbi:MAG: hypothetical protein KAW12_29620 [Candidatus Aminicenantes bacterium]|nr:hypothetical protein [Candidatus Aminicenantes bacterium]
MKTRQPFSCLRRGSHPHPMVIFIVLAVLGASPLLGDILTTVDRKVYEGKMVAFKYGNIIFNAYMFGKYHSKKSFPISQVWKIEFNAPKKMGLDESFEIEQKYKKLRRGKRLKKIVVEGNQDWVDTGINLKEDQNILFTVSGCIYIDDKTLVYQNGEVDVTWNKKKPLPNQPTGALIARVGEAGAPFYVGNDKAPFQVPGKGKLFLGVNDFNFADNTGKFIVSVYY